MPQGITFQLDRAGVRQVLTEGPMRLLVDAVAEEIAAHLRDQVPAGVVVDVSRYTTDRAAAAVTVLDARAAGWQARDGLLTRAAAASGVEVRAWQ
jgi:hypothetical protein